MNRITRTITAAALAAAAALTVPAPANAAATGPGDFTRAAAGPLCNTRFSSVDFGSPKAVDMPRGVFCLAAGWRLSMQFDGNVVIYDFFGRPVWWTGTGANKVPQRRLVVQQDGNVVVYRQMYGESYALWSTNTHS